MDSCWFENWFNTSYYHLLYSNRNDDEAQSFIDHLIEFVKLPKGAKVLDVACGKGRHSKYLNNKGYDVTGIDLSSESIKEAKRYENEHLEFMVHDMRVPFRSEEYQMAVNLFTSFGYFENHLDNEHAISTISSAVISNGIIIIDFFNAHLVRTHSSQNIQTKIEDIEFNTSKKIEDGFVIKNIHVIDKDKTYNFQEKVQLLNLSDFESYLSKVGLEIQNIFGNYNLEPFNLENSPRLIILAKKIAV